MPNQLFKKIHNLRTNGVELDIVSESVDNLIGVRKFSFSLIVLGVVGGQKM